MSRTAWVARCSSCNNVEHAPEARLWQCEKCGGETMGMVDVRISPPLEAPHVHVMSDLYMNGVRALDGVDIGSRRKRNEYKKVRGLVDTGDFKGEWDRAEKECAALRAGAGTNSEKHERTKEVVEAVQEIKSGKGAKALTEEEFRKF